MQFYLAWIIGSLHKLPRIRGWNKLLNSIWSIAVFFKLSKWGPGGSALSFQEVATKHYKALSGTCVPVYDCILIRSMALYGSFSRLSLAAVLHFHLVPNYFISAQHCLAHS